MPDHEIVSRKETMTDQEAIGHAITLYKSVHNCSVTEAADRVFGALAGHPGEPAAAVLSAALWPFDGSADSQAASGNGRP